jgi:hypothetical protein
LAGDYGTAGSQLGDDGYESSLGGGEGAAVGGVIAVPDGVGDGGVEIREVEGGNAAGGAVDEEPRAGLPTPAGCGVGGQGVVEAKDAADGEAAVGDVVGVAGGPLFLVVVDEEGTDLEGGCFVFFAVGGGVGLDEWDAANSAEGDDVDLRRGCSG